MNMGFITLKLNLQAKKKQFRNQEIPFPPFGIYYASSSLSILTSLYCTCYLVLQLPIAHKRSALEAREGGLLSERASARFISPLESRAITPSSHITV